MGQLVENIKITPDGIIEREDKIDAVLLNIIKVGSHKISPLASLKAQRKCFKIAKAEHKFDYKEYVERLQLDYYPKEFKRSELGLRLFFTLPFVILFTLSSIILLIVTINEFIWTINRDFENRYWGDFVVELICTIACLILAYLAIKKKNKLCKKIKDLSNE